MPRGPCHGALGDQQADVVLEDVGSGERDYRNLDRATRHAQEQLALPLLNPLSVT